MIDIFVGVFALSVPSKATSLAGIRKACDLYEESPRHFTGASPSARGGGLMG